MEKHFLARLITAVNLGLVDLLGAFGLERRLKVPILQRDEFRGAGLYLEAVHAVHQREVPLP